MTDIRAPDTSFVLDQLTELNPLEPTSPLAGRLGLQHVGMIGHSPGGATAVQVISTTRASRSASTSTALFRPR
jgi:predicted dienelactone hydrolase